MTAARDRASSHRHARRAWPRPRSRATGPRRAGRDVARDATGARLRRPRVRGFFRLVDADRRDRGAPPGVAAGGPRAAGGRRLRAARDRRPAGDPVGVRLVAGPDRPARLVRPRFGARRVPATHGEAGGSTCSRAVPDVAVLRERPRQRRAGARPGRHRRRPPVRGARERRRPTPAAGGRSRPNTAGPVGVLRRITGRDGCSTASPDLRRADRAAQPVRRLAVGDPGDAARPSPGAPGRTTRSASALLRLVQLTVNGVAGGLQATG